MGRKMICVPFILLYFPANMYIDEEVSVDLFHIYKNLVSENSMVVCSDTSFFPNILYLRFCMINIGIVKKIM